MSDTLEVGDELAIGPPSRLRQFSAIMYKNMLLQMRSRFSFFGIRLGGVATVLLDISIPVLFIAAMCLVTEIPDVDTSPMVFKEDALRDAQWGTDRMSALKHLRATDRTNLNSLHLHWRCSFLEINLHM
jgi:hypothetical protein